MKSSFIQYECMCKNTIYYTAENNIHAPEYWKNIED